MQEFTKWEEKSIKINILMPIIFLVVGVILVIVMFSVKPKPVQVKKKDAGATAEVHAVAPEEKIDWDNF